MAKCRSCGAPLKWVEMASGKKMPLNEKPVGMVQVKEGIGEIIEVHMPHWATCPKSEEHRKK